MGCQTSYSCPVVIPSGLQGTAGINGTPGADGSSIYHNSIATVPTSSGTGDQILSSVYFPASTIEALDELELEGIFTISADFAGSISLKVGGWVIGTYTVVGDTSWAFFTYNIIIKSRIIFKTTSAAFYQYSVEIIGTPSTRNLHSLSATAPNYEVNGTLLCAATTNPSAGTVSVKPFTVKFNKYVGS